MKAQPIRVVVVDDSTVVRSCLARWLNDSGDLACVGAATNGLEAVSLIPAVKPDVVILDIEMPHMNGLEALPLIRVAAPSAAVIVSSRLTTNNAELALRCLQGGAAEVLPKPSAEDRIEGLAEFQREMLEKVRVLGRRDADAGGPARAERPLAPRVARSDAGASSARAPSSELRLSRPPLRRPAASPRPPAAAPEARPAAPRAIVVGASTGGPNACAEFIAGLAPMVPRAPVVVAQHMPPVFTRVFSNHLSAATGVPCREAQDGEPLLPGCVYIGPGGHHVTIGGSAAEPILIVDSRPPVRFSRPSVDLLFLSASRVFGAEALGVVLTGMGSDGLEGARAMVAAGARIYAQDKASSVVWGMPGAVARAGVASEILPPARLGAAVAAALR